MCLRGKDGYRNCSLIASNLLAVAEAYSTKEMINWPKQFASDGLAVSVCMDTRHF